MSVEYTINFREDYKNALMKFFDKNEIDISHIHNNDIFKLSLEFHLFQRTLVQDNSSQENISLDAKYSSDMMFKWLTHLEDQIEDSIEAIVELALENNITVNRFPLNIQLQLDIETRSFEIYETVNGFNINLEL